MQIIISNNYLCVSPGRVNCEGSKNRSVCRPDKVQIVSGRTESADTILFLRLNLGISRAMSEKTDRQCKELVSICHQTSPQEKVSCLLYYCLLFRTLTYKRKQLCPLCLLAGRWLNPNSINSFSQCLLELISFSLVEIWLNVFIS